MFTSLKYVFHLTLTKGVAEVGDSVGVVQSLRYKVPLLNSVSAVFTCQPIAFIQKYDNSIDTFNISGIHTLCLYGKAVEC